jgi:hypothetical protein
MPFLFTKLFSLQPSWPSARFVVRFCEEHMWQLFKRVVRPLVPETLWQQARRLLMAPGDQSVALRQELAAIALELAQTKAGVSAIQGQTNEALSHIVVLRQELAGRGVGSSGEAGLALQLSETKARVSALQGQSGEALSHIIVLRRELAEWAARPNGTELSPAPAERGPPNMPSPGYSDLYTLPRRLDCAAKQLEHCPSEQGPKGQHGLRAHYARIADLVSQYWIRHREPPQDLFPADDFSGEFAAKAGIEVPQLSMAEAPGLLPWRHLWFDTDCGILLILGGLIASSTSKAPHTAANAEVFVFDFVRMRCLPVTGFPTGPGSGAFWQQLGNLLIKHGVFRRVLIVPVGARESLVNDWIPGGTMHKMTSLAFSRLRKELGLAYLPFSAVLWQQGEGDARCTDISAAAYKMHFHDAVANLRANGVFAPVFVALSTSSKSTSDKAEYHNREVIRYAQSNLEDASCGILSGPDLDTAADPCCDVQDGEGKSAAELWARVLISRPGMLQKIPCIQEHVVPWRDDPVRV